MTDNTTRKKRKTNTNVKVYIQFTKKERESLLLYCLWQYQNWKKSKKNLENNLKDVALVGYLGFDAAFPIFARIYVVEEEQDGQKVQKEKMQSLESVLEEVARFLKSNYRGDRLYRTSINMVDYVSTKWGFLRICPEKTTSRKRRTELMNQIRDYFLHSAGSYPALRWGTNGYLVLGKKDPEKAAMKYIKKYKKLKEEYLENENRNPINFLEEKLQAYRGYSERPFGLHLLMILEGDLITHTKKDYNEAALEYINTHPKIKSKFEKQAKANKLQPAQFLIKNYKAMKVDYFIAPLEEENNLKKFDVVDAMHVPSVEVAIKNFTDKEYIVLAWLIFFYMKGYKLYNQFSSEEFEEMFCGKEH